MTFDEAARQAAALLRAPRAWDAPERRRDLLVVDWLGRAGRPTLESGWERHDGARWVAMARVPLWVWPGQLTPAIPVASLLLLAALLAWKAATGQLGLYVNAGYAPLVLLSVPLLGFLVAGGLQRMHSSHRPSSRVLLLLALPPLFALQSARPLGAEAVASGGVNNVAIQRGTARGDPRRLEALERDLLDWAVILAREPEPWRLAGQPVRVEGFVTYPAEAPALGPDTALVARFVMIHCTADASAVGLPMIPPRSDLPANTWVSVEGELALDASGSAALLVVVPTRVEPIPVPNQPYLLP